MSRLLLLLLLLLVHTVALAAEVKIAVAANFTAPMKEIAARFTEETGYKARVSYGSTGKLYAQILHGAPYHVFLAADQERPQLLYQSGHGQAPRTYAIGKLALWSTDAGLISGSDVLASNSFRKLAIANPKTAPYGMAALQILDELGVKQQLLPKLVRGDNIAQTYQFVMTENAQLGFVAISQVNNEAGGSLWVPSQSMYDPLRQDTILLSKGADNPAAVAFMDFLNSDASHRIVQSYGYGIE